MSQYTSAVLLKSPQKTPDDNNNNCLFNQWLLVPSRQIQFMPAKGVEGVVSFSTLVAGHMTIWLNAVRHASMHSHEETLIKSVDICESQNLPLSCRCTYT